MFKSRSRTLVSLSIALWIAIAAVGCTTTVAAPATSPTATTQTAAPSVDAASAREDDPVVLILDSLTASAELKSTHVDMVLEGRTRGDFFNLGSVGELELEDLTLTADVDVATGAWRGHLEAPTLLGITADFIGIGNRQWLRSSVGGENWIQFELPDSFSSAQTQTGARRMWEELLDRGFITPVLTGVTQCGDQQCQSVRVDIPVDALARAAGNGSSQGPAPWPSPTFSGHVDMEIRTSDHLPHRIVVRFDTAQEPNTTGRTTLDMTLSRFDEPVEIVAPDPNDVKEFPTYSPPTPGTPLPSVAPRPPSPEAQIDCSRLQSVVTDAVDRDTTRVGTVAGGCQYGLADRPGEVADGDRQVDIFRGPYPEMIEIARQSATSADVARLGDEAVWVADENILYALEDGELYSVQTWNLPADINARQAAITIMRALLEQV